MGEPFAKLVDTRVLERRVKKTKSHKKLSCLVLKNLVNIGHRVQKKEKEGTFKNLGPVTAQYNGIAACAYSLKMFSTVLYCPWSVACSINTSYYLSFGKTGPV